MLYKGYFNEVAYELIRWSLEKGLDRKKIVAIQRVADKLEIKYRKKNQISLEDITAYKIYYITSNGNRSFKWKHANEVVLNPPRGGSGEVNKI